MTKRNFDTKEKNNKKPRLENELEALWDDQELDESVFDAFIAFDSQIEKKDFREDESILPDYEVFKVPKKMFCSTQTDVNFQATTSKVSSYFNGKDTECNIQRLRIKCEEKDGEIAVLRGQLRDTKAQNTAEIQKAHSECKNKLGTIEKHMQKIKSELEFKNLEIFNLKQKVLNTNKLNISSFDEVSKSPSKVVLPKPVTHQKGCYNKLHTIPPIDYPLKDILNECMFIIIKNEKLIIDNKQNYSFKNLIPYFQNKTVSTRIISNQSNVDMQLIYPLMLKFCQLRSDEIDSLKNVDHINKIICAALQLLDDLFNLLKTIKSKLRTEDILEEDYFFLKCIQHASDTNSVYRDELGMKSSIVLTFLSKTLPHCTYLKNYFFENTQLNLKSLDSFTNSLPFVASTRIHTGQDFLNKLASILAITGEIRKTNIMPSFLKSIINLLASICRLKRYESLADVVCNCTKELIFLRLTHDILYEFTNLLREASRYTSFVQYLLNKTKHRCFVKKGVVYFSKDACRFNIFVLLFDKCLNKTKRQPIETCLNILYFIYNTYKSSYFLHHQNTKECECLPQLYKLEIEIILRILERYAEEVTKRDTKRKLEIIKHKIILKILNLMTFHSCELTEKYITAYSQFKEIERQLYEQGVCDLERWNTNEEIPEIDSKSFDNIEF